MRINEVIKTKQLQFTQKNVEDYLNRIDLNQYSKENFNVKELDVYKEKSLDNSIVYIITYDDNPIGFLQLYRFKNNIFKVRIAGVSKNHKRQGIMKELYKQIVKNTNYKILSDNQWTEGAEMLWKSLMKEKDVNVLIYDEETDEAYKTKKLPRRFFQNKYQRLLLIS